jgi:hypothetical protein
MVNNKAILTVLIPQWAKNGIRMVFRRILLKILFAAGAVFGWVAISIYNTDTIVIFAIIG